MKMLLKVFAASLTLLVGLAPPTCAQRCGGSVEYVLRNDNGDIIDAKKASVKYVRTATYSGNQLSEDRYYRSDWVRDSITLLRIRTGCGMYLIEIALEYDGRTMLLRLHNVPMETNCLLDSIPFHDGTYEIDFKRNMKLEGQALNREGLKTKEGKGVLRGVAKAGLLVSAENWTRTNSK